MSEQHEKHEGISGVFSSQEIRKVGTGTTTRKTIQKAFWYCIEQPDGSVEVQPLNTNYIPSGPKRKVPMDDFLAGFAPEPELYVANVFPKMRELNKTIARADRHRANKEMFSAEMEYGNALKVDEENIRANFGLGITYLERGDTAKADNIFERLVKLDAAFDKEHKHLFNEFGINLRKSKMIDQAVAYYTKALDLTPDDEHLLYNMARAYLEKQDYETALKYLLRSLEANPTLDVSIKFLGWMIMKELVPANEKKTVETALLRIKQAESGAAPAGEPSAGGEPSEGGTA
jgi:tetratricopeptide (TPR) repeat protein